MGVKTSDVVSVQHEVNVIKKVLDHLQKINPDLKFPSPSEIDSIRKQSAKELQEKHKDAIGGLKAVVDGLK